MISVVTVNYNGWELTSALIRSLECHVHTPLEVIVVDNGSRMDEAALLCARHPHIRAIRSHRNLGFAGGNNLGIAAASGQYLLLLNNDTEVEQDTLPRDCGIGIQLTSGGVSTLRLPAGSPGRTYAPNDRRQRNAAG